MVAMKQNSLFGRRLSTIAAILTTCACVVKGATIPPPVHHYHHHTHYVQSPLQEEKDPVEKSLPIPSSGDATFNPWLYRFPPWGGAQNPLPPSLKLTNSDAIRSRNERDDKDIPYHGVGNSSSDKKLEEISILGSDPYKDQVIQTMIENEFKDASSSSGSIPTKPLIIKVEYDKVEDVSPISDSPSATFEDGFIASQVIDAVLHHDNSMFITTERIPKQSQDRQRSRDYPSNYKKSFDGMDLIPSKFLHFVDKKIFSPPTNIVSVPKFAPLPLQEDDDEEFHAFSYSYPNGDNHRSNILSTNSKSNEPKAFRPSQRFDGFVPNTGGFVPHSKSLIHENEDDSRNPKSLSAERSLSELINDRWTRPAKRKTLDDPWIWHR